MSKDALQFMNFADRKALLSYINQRVADWRESLEAPFIDHRLADYYRGRIAELKELKEQLTE